MDTDRPPSLKPSYLSDNGPGGFSFILATVAQTWEKTLAEACAVCGSETSFSSLSLLLHNNHSGIISLGLGPGNDGLGGCGSVCAASAGVFAHEFSV